MLESSPQTGHDFRMLIGNVLLFCWVSLLVKQHQGLRFRASHHSRALGGIHLFKLGNDSDAIRSPPIFPVADFITAAEPWSVSLTKSSPTFSRVLDSEAFCPFGVDG